jgi:peptidoglycan/xylan/chitin deacetylase (PgdA/CDA1 family)
MEADRTIVLVYHSHHVVGTGYAENDHVALAHDLPLVRSLRGRFVPLPEVVAGLSAAPCAPAPRSGARLRVALTFDDGPVYDVAPFVHPVAGPQPGFLAILQAFARTLPDDERAALRATSFVIASPAARRHMEASFDTMYTYLGAGSMTDDWWRPALDTGLFDIANHSWDHLHPALPEVAHSAQAKGDFTQVTSTADADRQIAVAFAHARRARRVHGGTDARACRPKRLAHSALRLRTRLARARSARAHSARLTAAVQNAPMPATLSMSVSWSAADSVRNHFTTR